MMEERRFDGQDQQMNPVKRDGVDQDGQCCVGFGRETGGTEFAYTSSEGKRSRLMLLYNT